jgi:RNA methyltransferase, TrmH family
VAGPVPGRPDRPVLSARNPRLAELRRLSGRRSARAAAGRFVIDGPRLVTEALAAGVVLHEVFVPVGAVDDPLVVALLAALDRARIPVDLVPTEAFAGLSSTESPQPALAVATPPRHELAAVLDTDALLVLVDVADPGNAGTLVRVAEAAGLGGVVACGQAVDWWNPKVVRAAAGSLFRVPVATADDTGAVLDALRARGIATLATVVDDAVPYTDVDWCAPVAVVLGSEAHGLAPEVVARATGRIHIPMLGSVESLNVAMAGAVCAFELARRRRADPSPIRPQTMR